MSADGVWGVGFACDSLFETTSVRDWSELCEGEAVRFFPALRRRSEGLSPQLAKRVLKRAAEIEHHLKASNSEKRNGDLSAQRPQSGAGRISGAGWPSETSEDASWLRLLVTSANFNREAGDMQLMAKFAFLTGLHPAYLWPEIEILPSWGATAAWLGEFSRRRRAFMPPEVADYLNDTLTERHGRIVVQDASLSNLLRDDAVASILRLEARRCIAGDVAEVRYPSRGFTGEFFAVAIGSAWLRIRSFFSENFRRAK